QWPIVLVPFLGECTSACAPTASGHGLSPEDASLSCVVPANRRVRWSFACYTHTAAAWPGLVTAILTWCGALHPDGPRLYHCIVVGCAGRLSELCWPVGSPCPPL